MSTWSGAVDGNGNYHGAGTETWCGTTAVGTYVHGKSHGPWVITWPSGEVCDKVWDNGRRVSSVMRVSKLQTHT